MEKTLPNKPQSFSLSEALRFKDDIVDNWTPLSDVWALRHGGEVLGAITAFGGIFITHDFRRELKLRPFARITCYAPSVGLSAIAVALFQNSFVTSQILRKNYCSTCVTTKSVIGEILIGFAYPLVITPIVCFYVADRLLTYPVPPLRRAPKELFALYKKILMKNPRPYYILGAIHVASAFFITYHKIQNMRTLQEKSSY